MRVCGVASPWRIRRPRRNLAEFRRPPLERGDPGVAIGTLADVLVVLGLLEQLADLIDVRKDDLGLALAVEHGPRRGRSFAARLRKQKTRTEETQDRGTLWTLTWASF